MAPGLVLGTIVRVRIRGGRWTKVLGASAPLPLVPALEMLPVPAPSVSQGLQSRRALRRPVVFHADFLSLLHVVVVTVTGNGSGPGSPARLLCRPLGHEEALSAFTLKKLLLLVCFLDRAKLSRLIDHDPCLFCKDSEFKVRLPSCLSCCTAPLRLGLALVMHFF